MGNKPGYVTTDKGKKFSRCAFETWRRMRIIRPGLMRLGSMGQLRG